MNQPPYGAPPHGQPPHGGFPGQPYGGPPGHGPGPGGPGPGPGGWGGPPPPSNNKGAIIAVVVLLVVAIGVVLTLWLTGVFGGSSKGDNISVASPSAPYSTPSSTNSTYVTTNTVSPSGTTSTGISPTYLSGRWCDTTGGWMSFDTASNQINLPNGNTGQRVVGTYSLNGSNLTIIGPSGARISGTLAMIDQQTMNMTIMGRVERVTRC